MKGETGANHHFRPGTRGVTDNLRLILA